MWPGKGVNQLAILWWMTTLFRLSVTIIFRDAKQFIPHRFDHRKL